MVLPYEFEIVFKSLPLEEAGRLILAIYDYEQRNISPDFSGNPALKFAWNTHIKPKIDENVEKYDAICKARKNAGSKGGRPSQNNQDKPKKANGFFDNQNNQMGAKKPDCDGDGDCDGDINNKKEKPTKEKEGWEEIVQAYEQRFPMTLSSYKSQQLEDIFNNYGKDAVLFAIREARSGNAKQPIPYIRTVAMNYSRKEPEPMKESPQEIGERIRKEAEKRRAEGKSVTMDEIKQKVREDMKRKGMTIVGESNTA